LKANENSKNEIAAGRYPLPLYDFFIALKQNNFLVTPGQISDSNSIIAQYAATVNNEQELCNYLAPVFANSEEEQIQFREIFEQYFKEKIIQKPHEEPDWTKRAVIHFRKYSLIYMAAFVLVVLSVILYNQLKPIPPPPPTISIVSNIAEFNPDGSKGTGISYKGRKVAVQLFINGKLADSVNDISLKSTFNWGDRNVEDTLPYHVYNTGGNFIITAFVNISYGRGLSHFSDTAVSTVAGVCLENKSISIETNHKGDSVKIGDKILLRAGIAGKQPDSISWSGSDNADLVASEKGRALLISFPKEGPQTVYCNAVYDSANSPCSAQNSVSFIVYDPKPKPQLSFSIPANASIIPPKYKVDQKWFYWLWFLTPLFLVLASLFAKRWQRSKKEKKIVNEEIKSQYTNLVQSFNARLGPANIPFQNKNYLPLIEPEIGLVAKGMRKRISDDTSFLHLQKTIAKAILNAGFFQPVNVARTQQAEYLVLIDENNSNSQQVKLFEYLLDLLAKQNVFIEKYYYRHEPKSCYSINQPNGISLEKLSERYPKHILLIFGNAYQLVYQLYPVIDNSYLQLLNRWQYKAILTPVPFPDWGNKEKRVLQEELPVLPVDIPGQLLLLQKLFDEQINVLEDLKQYSDSFYDAESFDFEDVDELKDYCENAAWANTGDGVKYSNILFQWVAALAVYPKIQWELTLAIGKSIMDKYGKTTEMNFTTLLRIARIKWMRDGRFPEFTRLNLLKHLAKENEVTARETILSGLNEIPETELSNDHFAFEEKETQRLVNEFSLYAYDPVKYVQYQKSKDLFTQLRLNKQMTDITTESYFENKNLQWTTLINKPGQPGILSAKPDNIPLDRYPSFKPDGQGLLTRIYFWSAAVSSLLFTALVIGWIALGAFNYYESRAFVPFTFKQPFSKEIKFTYTDAPKTNPYKNVVLTVDTFQTDLNADSISTLSLPVNDFLKNISITEDGADVFDTAMAVVYDEYNIAVLGIKTHDTTNIDSTKGKPLVTSVFIQVSETGLTGSANAFKKELESKGFMVNAVALGNNNYNSEISYYTAGMRNSANEIKQYYNKYFPDLNIPVRLKNSNIQVNTDNRIIVWIRKYEPVAPARFKIGNVEFQQVVKQNELLNVSFDIINNGVADRTKIQGRICILSDPSCFDFEFSQIPSIKIKQPINLEKFSIGRHEIRVVIDGAKINQSLGFFTIESPADLPKCDTIHSYIGDGAGNILFNGKRYIKQAHSKLGIDLRILELNEKYAVFAVSKDKCPSEKLTVAIGGTQNYKFCDGATLKLNLLNWNNKRSVPGASNRNLLNAQSKVPDNPEAIFDAILCELQQNNAEKAKY
jgi:hypothetical protein